MIELSEAAFGLAVQNDLVFIAGPSDGLVIADIHDKNSPRIISTYQTRGINVICVENQIAYAGTQQGELLIMNIENPTKPVRIGSYASQGGMELMAACQ